MRATQRVLLLSVTVGLCSLAARAAPPATLSSSSASADAVDPAVTVRAALSLEIDGLDEDRNALLQQVIDEHPGYAPARAHRGEIRVGENWLPYDRVVHEGERWHQLYMYRKTRDERGDTIDDHLFLVDGARQRKMWDEERCHLIRILEKDVNHAEARRRLGDVMVDDIWISREDVVGFQNHCEELRRDLAEWGPLVNPSAQRLLSGRRQARLDAIQELEAIRDRGAIPAVELALARGGEQDALWYLDWLAACDAWQASVAMARQAVFAPSAKIRAKAQQLLRVRRVDDYVPLLLGALRADLRLTANLDVTPFGGLLYVQHISYETQNERRERNLAILYGPESERGRWSGISDGGLVNMPGGVAAALRHLRQFYGAFTFNEALSASAQTEVANGRVVRTLAAALDQPALHTPQQCWDWWNGYQELYVSSAPKARVGNDYEEIWAVEREKRRITREPARYIAPNMSCFASGTPVVTEFGPKAIEEIKLGDRVLAQDVDSGEVDFKPVFKTTVRPPTPLLKLVTAHGELVCTGGHPFWINDHGWLKARELEPGMRLHSVTGSSEVLAVEDAQRTARAYNLVVADFHTYFVGDGRILSHDNTPRNPTNSIVPGLEREFTIAAAP